MRKLIAFTVLASALPGAAFAGNSGTKDAADSKRAVCVKATDTKAQARERRAECRLPRPVPAIVDPTPVFIL